MSNKVVVIKDEDEEARAEKREEGRVGKRYREARKSEEERVGKREEDKVGKSDKEAW